MNTNVSVNVNGAVITDRAACVLLEMQKDNNDFIDIYNRHLDKVSDLLFRIGNEMSENQSKDEVFALLNYTHLLRKDLNALKAPANIKYREENKTSACYQTSPDSRLT